MKCSRQELRDFLVEAKGILTDQSGTCSWEIAKREKNLECIATLGYTLSDVRDTILDLSVDDYCDGPVQNLVERGWLWIFGKTVNGKELYIKLKVVTVGILRGVRVVSFHECEEQLSYPFR